MSARIGTISGVFLTPGISRNNRYYSPEVVRAAVENMRTRLGNGDLISMATSHAAGRTDDALSTAATVREVWLDDNGAARFRADVPGTTTGRDALELLRGKYAGGVSIDGDWFNVRRTITPGGAVAEAGDNLFVKRIDLTGNRGVLGAAVDEVAITESVQTNGAVSIRESFDSAALLIETDGATSTTSDAPLNAAESATPQETPVTAPKQTETPEAQAVTEAVVAAPAAVELSESAVKSLATAIAEALAPVIAAAKPVQEVAPVAAPTTEPTPLTESTVKQLIADSVEEMKAEVRKLITETPAFGRRGFVVRASESADSTVKPLHEMSQQELQAQRQNDSVDELNSIIARAV